MKKLVFICFGANELYRGDLTFYKINIERAVHELLKEEGVYVYLLSPPDYSPAVRFFSDHRTLKYNTKRETIRTLSVKFRSIEGMLRSISKKHVRCCYSPALYRKVVKAKNSPDGLHLDAVAQKSVAEALYNNFNTFKNLKKIICYGDSNTVGTSLTHARDAAQKNKVHKHAWPTVLRKKINDEMKTNVELEIYGYNGATHEEVKEFKSLYEASQNKAKRRRICM